MLLVLAGGFFLKKNFLSISMETTMSSSYMAAFSLYISSWLPANFTVCIYSWEHSLPATIMRRQDWTELIFTLRAIDLGLCSLALEFSFPAQFSAVQMRQSFVGLYMTWLALMLRATMLAKGLEEADSFFLFSVKVLCTFKAIKSTCQWKAECAQWMLWGRYSGWFFCLWGRVLAEERKISGIV